MKHIKLTRNQVTIIDDIDYDWVKKFNWFALNGKGRFYAARQNADGKYKQKISLLSREIMGNPKNKLIDHINGDTLDNRRENLRICTRSQNNQNRSKLNRLSSFFKGVSFEKKYSKWRAEIKKNGIKHFLGYFTSESDAAKSYDQVAKRLHGQFAKLNFNKY